MLSIQKIYLPSQKRFHMNIHVYEETISAETTSPMYNVLSTLLTDADFEAAVKTQIRSSRQQLPSACRNNNSSSIVTFCALIQSHQLPSTVVGVI
jgi:hypothetical protein